MIGFNVVSTLPLLSGKDRELWFVAQGRFEAIPWIDNISGILAAVVCLAAIVWLVRRKHIQTTMGSRTTPVFVLAVASISAVAMPVGGYWDISFHSESGRETFFSPPHLLIYGGILLALLAVLISLVRKPKEVTWSENFYQDKAVAIAAIAILFLLGSAPFDELWHFMFGLDVSVWSPPHAVLIFGGVTLFLALASIHVRKEGPATVLFRGLALAGALLTAEVFLAESEFPFPSWHSSQFRPQFVYPFFLFLFGLVVGLTAKRSLAFRFGAVLTVALFLLLRLMIYPVLMLAERANAPRFSLWLVVLLFLAVFVDWFAKTKVGSSSMTKMLPG